MKDKTAIRCIQEELRELKEKLDQLQLLRATYEKDLKEVIERENRYRTLVEESFDGIFVQKRQKIVFANRRLHEMLGYDQGDLIGLDHWKVFSPEYQDLTRERALARMRGEAVPSQYEVKLQRKDGSWFYGEVNAKAITFDGEPGVQVWIRDITERKENKEILQRWAQTLSKRVKELNCLYSISNLIEDHSLSLDEILQRTLDIIAEAFEFPEITQVQIIVGDRIFETKDFSDTPWKLTAEINVKTGPAGILKICYKKNQTKSQDPFFKEERDLLSTIAMRLGEVIDSKNAQEALRARELELEEKARQLEELNTALKVLLEHRNEEKYQLQKDILSNIEKLVYPYLDRLYETRLDWKQKALVGIIKSNLGNLSLPFANQLNSRTLNLTPAELRIADLIRNGKTTKEIAQLLGLSYDTICCHRRNIRSKLGLIKRRINLRSYLLSIGRNQDMERASP